jgi:hypothetical protein
MSAHNRSKREMEKQTTSRTIFQWPWSRQLSEQSARDWMESNAERLRPHVVAVPRPWRKAAIADKWFPCQCYRRAVQFVHRSPHLPEALYVMGETYGAGFLDFKHGWVELEDRVVFDGVMQEFYDKAGYYTAERAVPWYRFTRPAVMFLNRKMSKDPTMTYLWDCELKLPWAEDPLHPLLVDLDRAKAGLAARAPNPRPPRQPS